MACSLMKTISRLRAAMSGFVLGLAVHAAGAAIQEGALRLAANQLAPGQSFELTGQWYYQPGYTLQPADRPETVMPAHCVRVPVPQLLNRIHWWLDDSEDFNQRETARLQALGFDTERAEDGWYYLRLDLPALPADRHLFLEFDGVAMVSRAYCNGRLLGEHKGMFSRFSYLLTPHLRLGENLLAVHVSMEKIPASTLALGEAVTVNLTASKVLTMSKGMFGPLSPNFDNRAYDLHGIWQPVRLVVRGGARLDDVWFIPTLDSAEVRVEAAALAGNLPVRVRARWTNSRTGELFAEVKSPLITLRETPSSHSLVLRAVTPKLWTPAEPNLYRLTVTLESAAGDQLDAWTRNVGFRTFTVQGNQFYLNGKPYWLRGANHLPYGKNPCDPALPRKLIRLLHEANVRVTRTHATPWNEAWLDAADEIGLGVSLEGIRPWALCGRIGATPPELFAHWLMENADVVKRCRNHPSVLLYTIGNEMMLRDGKNLEKWGQLSTVVRQTRQLDPTRPVICSSEYTRDPNFYRTVLEPNGMDDGDVDDLHRYHNWYAPSSFVTDARFAAELKRNGGHRPLIGQEMSTGYPDLDTGLPVRRYTRDLLTPQAWVGQWAYPGQDPAVFLDHHRAVTKRWAERLRFERGTNTAGFLLFAAECWFAHSYDPATVKPYPVLAAVRDAWAPVGLAWETGRRRFYAGETVATAVFVTNDDEQGRDLAGLSLEMVCQDNQGGRPLQRVPLGRLPKLSYYETARVPVQIQLPEISADRVPLRLTLILKQDGRELGSTTDQIEVFAQPPTRPRLAAVATAISLGPQMRQLAEGIFADLHENLAKGDTRPGVVLLGPSASLKPLEAGGSLQRAVQAGATLIVFAPDKSLVDLFPEALLEAGAAVAEFADFTPLRTTPLGRGLAPMDLKWWGRTDDARMFVASQSHRLRPDGPAREMVRYIPPHGYLAAERLPEQYRTVLFELLIGAGRIWVCDLDCEETVGVDPAARRFAGNLLRAAAAPDALRGLTPFPSHEQSLRGIADPASGDR